jgi:hypothetical protein
VYESRRDFEEARQKVIERALYVGERPTQEALALQRGYSLRKALVTDVAQAALQHCQATGRDVHVFKDLAGSGVDIVDSVEYSLTENKRFDLSENAKPEFNWNFWEHEKPHVIIKAQKLPYISRFGIQEVATSYLDLPYRAPLLERTIVDILIALELYAFSKEILEKPPVGMPWTTRSPLQQKHALRRYLVGQFWGGLTFLGLAYLVGTYGPTLIGETASAWVAGTFVVFFFLDLVFSTVFLLPVAWRKQRRSKGKVRDLMIAMSHTYSELSGEGQVSTRRLREVAARAADDGVVWPKALFLILDDNIARIGRI